MGAGSGAKRRQIANYMDSLPEEFEVLEDQLDADDPSIKLQTKTRIISLSCDDKANVVEDFRMRKGAGSKDDFLVKQEAYNAISNYYNDYYTGAKVVKKSFEEGILKIELENRVVTLTYDAATKSVEEKDRAKRSTKTNNSSYQQITLFDLPKNKKSDINTQQETKKVEESARKTQVDSEKKTETKVDVSTNIKPVVKEKKYNRWSDGTIVKNICNNKEYRVKRDEGNIIEVFDKEHGYLIMARSDLVLSD
ncbi:MAG: hypothetical protein K6D38_07275 [Pseudobutyrivibrio sp.]|nr:hypothetical protein [Pseudobutyrivibrio sp.]